MEGLGNYFDANGINHQNTGKTFETYLYLRRNPDLRPAIIICPASIKWSWQNEASRHFGMLAEVLGGTKPAKEGLIDQTSHGIFIVNFDVIWAWVETIKAIGPKVIVIDEAQRISSRTNRWTRAIRELCRGVQHILPLSGTPLTNRPAELFQVLNLVRPSRFPSFWRYAHDWCQPKMTRFGWDFSGCSKDIHKLHDILIREGIMIRRLKKDVLPQLPPKTRSIVPVDISDRQDYELAVKNFLTWLIKHQKNLKTNRGRRVRHINQLVQEGHLRRLAGRLKLKSVMAWVDSFLSESDGKLVLFAIHKPVVQALRERYKKLAVVVDGSVTGQDRQKAVDAFQNHPGVRLFIGNIKAAGVGLTLTAASTAAFAELEWTPAAMVQAEDRLHRISATEPVQIFWLIAKDTFETKVAEIIQTKAQILSAVLDGGRNPDEMDVADQLAEVLRQELLSFKKKGKKCRTNQ